ncbi:MAG: substrate-binding periplasmic protein [Puniceicoccaceae bacterium]
MRPLLSRPPLPRPTAILLSAAIALAAFALGGCRTVVDVSDVPEVPPSRDILRIGVTPNMPPFVFEEDGGLVGIEVDCGKALAAELGREPRFVRMDWDQLIPALRKNRIDIVMSGMNYTRERAAVVALTNPYLRSGQKALVLRKNEARYIFPGQIAKTKARVGAESGTTGEFLVESGFPDARLVSYPSADRGARAVASGEIELFIHDAPTVLWMAGVYQNEGLTAALPVLSDDLMVWAVARQNTSLLESANAILADWRQDGTMAGILRRWTSL